MALVCTGRVASFKIPEPTCSHPVFPWKGFGTLKAATHRVAWTLVAIATCREAVLAACSYGSLWGQRLGPLCPQSFPGSETWVSGFHLEFILLGVCRYDSIALEEEEEEGTLHLILVEAPGGLWSPLNFPSASSLTPPSPLPSASFPADGASACFVLVLPAIASLSLFLSC